MAPALDDRLAAAFARGAGHGLLHLGATEVGSVLPPGLAWWRNFAAGYVTALCAAAEVEMEGTHEGPRVAPPSEQSLDSTIADAPPMQGAEYLTPEVLHRLWVELDAALQSELAESTLPLQDFLKARHPAWNLVGRVHFNLAENRRDEAAPFAFLATYTRRLSAHGKAQHVPLSQALHRHRIADRHQRLRQVFANRIRISTVIDDEIFAVRLFGHIPVR